MGVDAWRIEQVPMPVRHEFRPFTSAAREAFHDEMKLDHGSTILLNGGARGGGPLLSVYHAMRKAAPDANILVVCGRNDTLRQRLSSSLHPKTRLFGFVNDIHRLIAGSDLVLTKPGALSTYETLACGVPVLLLGLRGLMPQETGLFHAAAHYEFGFVASRLGDVQEIVSQGRHAWNRIRTSLAAFYELSHGEEIIERILHAHAPA
jgi:predicted glycosyltransferase